MIDWKEVRGNHSPEHESIYLTELSLKQFEKLKNYEMLNLFPFTPRCYLILIDRRVYDCDIFDTFSGRRRENEHLTYGQLDGQWWNSRLTALNSSFEKNWHFGFWAKNNKDTWKFSRRRNWEVSAHRADSREWRWNISRWSFELESKLSIFVTLRRSLNL